MESPLLSRYSETVTRSFLELQASKSGTNCSRACQTSSNNSLMEVPMFLNDFCNITILVRLLFEINMNDEYHFDRSLKMLLGRPSNMFVNS